jgi:hypothetical protein
MMISMSKFKGVNGIHIRIMNFRFKIHNIDETGNES